MTIQPPSNDAKLALEIEELQLKVADLKRPSYKRQSFWIAVAAVVGVIAQGYLSQIKSERADLRVEKAQKEVDQAVVRRDSAVAQERSAVARIASANDTLSKIAAQVRRLQGLAAGQTGSVPWTGELQLLAGRVLQAQAALLHVSAISTEVTGVQRQRLSLSSDPGGAAVYLVPQDTWQAMSLSLSSDTLLLEPYHIGRTPTMRLVEPGWYVALFDLHGSRKTLKVEIKE